MSFEPYPQSGHKQPARRVKNLGPQARLYSSKLCLGVTFNAAFVKALAETQAAQNNGDRVSVLVGSGDDAGKLRLRLDPNGSNKMFRKANTMSVLLRKGTQIGLPPRAKVTSVPTVTPEGDIEVQYA